MRSNVEIINKLNLPNPEKIGGRASIANGSTVSGRVIAKNPDGTYLVSLAGAKINVKSKFSLRQNQIFTAKVSVKNGVVFLSAANLEKNEESAKIPPDLQNGRLNQKAAEFLKSLGLEPTSQAFSLIQFMQKTGMKINADSVKKSMKNLRKFDKNKRMEAAEISLLLDEKGIPCDEKAVADVMSYCDEKNHGKRKNGNDSPELFSNEKFNGKNLDFDKNSAEAFVKNYFDSVEKSAAANKNGILTAFNSLKNSKKNGYSSDFQWVLLPFEWAAFDAFGDIRLLINGDFRNLQKIVINCEKNVQKFKFVVYLNQKKVKSLKFGLSFASKSKKIEFEKMLSDSIKKCGIAPDLESVELVDFERLDSFGVEEGPLSAVSTFA